MIRELHTGPPHAALLQWAAVSGAVSMLMVLRAPSQRESNRCNGGDEVRPPDLEATCTFEDVERLVNLQQLECAARPPPLLFGFPIEDVPFVLRYGALQCTTGHST